jgi:hypothetical protein
MARRMVSEMMRPAVVFAAFAKALAAERTSSSRSRVVRIKSLYLMHMHQMILKAIPRKINLALLVMTAMAFQALAQKP